MNQIANKPRQDPHHDAPVVSGGVPNSQAEAALVLLHGRGGSAKDMLSLAEMVGVRRVAFLALQAKDSSWYPYSFLEALERNEPWLSSALSRINRLMSQLGELGLPLSRVGLLGFSQGACLALEYAARNPQRFGSLIGLSGGLIGPPGNHWDYQGSLEQTPVFLGCSDADPHIPKKSVDEAGAILEQLGGQVTKCLYPRLGHTINQDEVDAIKQMLQNMLP